MSKKPKVGEAAAPASASSDAEDKFLLMVIVQITLTIFVRTLNFISAIYYTMYVNFTALFISTMCDLSITFAGFCIFFIFFFYNKIFKKEFLRIFNKNIQI